MMPPTSIIITVDDNCNFQKVIKSGAILPNRFICVKSGLNKSRDN